jgi:DNA-binding HxlR family transcriptional regulator
VTDAQRSGCPISLTLEVLGDRWTLLIIRDLMFRDRRYFRELLTLSEEGIASNILAARLKRLLEVGLITRADDPSHKQKGRYSLTEPAIQLVPILAELGGWGRKHRPATEELAIRARVLKKGGPDLWGELMDELRADHLGAKRPKRSARADLQAAYEKAAAKKAAAA